MFTYVRSLQDRAAGAGAPEETPEYFDKIHKIVEAEGGTVERFLAMMGPFEYLGIFEYPNLEAAFRVLGGASRSSRCSRPRRSPQRKSSCS